VQQLEAAGIPYRIAGHPAQAWTGLWAALQGGLAYARTAMQLPTPLVANTSMHRLQVSPFSRVVLHRGSNAATPAIDALHSLLGATTQDALAGLTHPQTLAHSAKSISGHYIASVKTIKLCSVHGIGTVQTPPLHLVFLSSHAISNSLILKCILLAEN